MRRIPFGFVALFAFVTPGLAIAQVTSEQAATAAKTAGSNLPPDSFGGELMFGKLAEDYYLSLALRLNFDREMWGVGVQVPLRFRLIDRDPKTNDFGGILRREDWDEVSDFLRIIRYVYVGQADKKGPFYVRIGELSGLTVGHGTIMYRYFNGLDRDVWHTGFNGALNVGAFGAETVVGDVVDPYVIGARFTVKPLELAYGEGFFWEKLVVGASIIGDARAPYELQMIGTSSVALDEHSHPVVAAKRPMAIFGIDVGLEVFSNELFSITPYIDLNKMSRVDYGWGLHMGILWQLRFPLLIDTLTIDARTEYRRVSGDYIGPYFNTAYEIERYQEFNARNTGVMRPKLYNLINSGLESRNGVFFDLLAGLPEFVFVGGEFIDYDGGHADGTLRLSLEIPALEVVQLSAFYYRVGISGAEDLFALDDRSAVVAQVSIPLYYVFSLQARFIRVWEADPAQAGQFNAVDEYSFGVGFSLEF
jgi:hypothetical protein